MQATGARASSSLNVNALVSPRGHNASSRTARGNCNFQSTFKRPFSYTATRATKGSTFDGANTVNVPARNFTHAAVRARFATNVTLANGVQADVRELDLASGSQDEKELSAFYHGLSSFSGIKGDRCSDRSPLGSGHISFHAPRQLEIAQKCIASGGRVLALRARVGGEETIVGACMMNYDDRAGKKSAIVSRMVVGDDFRRLGVADALKKAQIRCATEEGAESMSTYVGVDEDIKGLYRKVCRELGLPLQLTAWGAHVDLRPDSRPAPGAGTLE